MAEEKKKNTTSKNSNKKGSVKNSSKSTTSKKVSPKKSTSTKKVSSNNKVAPKKKSAVTTTNLEEKKNNSIKIEIEKEKLIKIVLITIVIIVLCLICFFASNSNSEKYSNSSNSSSETTESSEDDSGLAQATKEAGEVSDDERVEANKISVSDYIDLYKSDTDSLVLLSKESCGYCQIAIPIIENIIYKNKVEINMIDVGNMSSEEASELLQSDSYFSEGYGTPLIMVVGNNSIKDKIEGLTTRDGYESFFKQYGFME